MSSGKGLNSFDIKLVFRCMLARLKEQYLNWKLKRETKKWYEAQSIIRCAKGDVLEKYAEICGAEPRKRDEKDSQFSDRVIKKYREQCKKPGYDDLIKRRGQK